ncbi:MAG: DUF302 domain-containing protein [Rhodobacteraceae bacterium]|nr:DUF302 domain-containing protein [Paracoccaceae bacterium]
MTSTINRMISDAKTDDLDARMRKALADHGFGVLTEIDVKATKKKPDVDMPACRTSGARDPKMACRASGREMRGGATLSCNVTLTEVVGRLEISAIDPVASMRAIKNPELHAVAGQVRNRPAKAVAAA